MHIYIYIYILYVSDPCCLTLLVQLLYNYIYTLAGKKMSNTAAAKYREVSGDRNSTTETETMTRARRVNKRPGTYRKRQQAHKTHALFCRCMHACMHQCMHVCTCVCMYIRVRACMHACTYVCMCVCINACMYAHAASRLIKEHHTRTL